MPSPSNPSVISLWGNNHEDLGEIATDVIAPDVAIGISRGRFPKGYAHVDANEDGLIAASIEDATLLAVVDGHSGFEAAEATLKTIASHSPQLLTTRQTDLQDALTDCLEDASQAISDVVTDRLDQRSHSRTAVTVVVLKADTITMASAGDTSAVLLSAGASQIINTHTDFLGPRTTSKSIVTSTISSSPDDLVVVCSDGLSDFLGRSWPRRLNELAVDANLETIVRDAIGAAFLGGAGDNVAVAVARVRRGLPIR